MRATSLLRRAAAASLVSVVATCGGDKNGPTDPPSGTPAIAVALSAPSLTLTPGESGTATVTITRSGGFTGPVTLNVSGTPAGVSATFDPTTVSGGASSSALTIAAGSSAAPGTYQLRIRGQGQGVAEQIAPLSLTVSAPPSTGYRGTLTLARGVASAVFEEPEEIVDFDLASAAFTVRFNGIDPHRVRSGETAFLARLAPGAVANRGVVVADARGVTGAPLYICRDFSWLSNRICHTPRLSPNKQLVAFGTAGDGGSVCQDSYGLYWANYVVVLDRNATEVARFEGYYMPDWLPDGRLLMMGSACRNAGVWIADASLRTLTRVDGNQVGTPGGQPAVGPDGSRVHFVWNQQLWMLTLDGRSELTRLTAFPFSVTSATWSPDGSAVALLAANESLPMKAVILFRLGDEEALAVSLPFFPFGPISWQ